LAVGRAELDLALGDGRRLKVELGTVFGWLPSLGAFACLGIEDGGGWRAATLAGVSLVATRSTSHGANHAGAWETIRPSQRYWWPGAALSWLVE